jgi:23S rRNA (uracil1939-C5)-methyltransferase
MTELLYGKIDTESKMEKETHVVSFEKLVFGGDCLGRLADGRAVFVPFVLPGETAEIEIIESKERFARGLLIKLLEESPDRIEAPCPYFGICGGCHYQHLAYSKQLNLKKDLVIDQLQRIGKFTDLPKLEITPSPLPFHYRNQAQFHPVETDSIVSLGFKKASSNEVLPIARCLLIPDDLCQLLPQLELESDSGINRLAMRIDSDGELMLVFEGKNDNPPELSIELPVSSAYLSPDGRNQHLSGNDALVYSIMGKEFLVSPESFFQVNLPVAEEMLHHVLALIESQHDLNILELYSGVGLFTRFLAPHASQLTAIESSASANFDFVTNLEEYDNISLYEGAVEEILPGIVDQVKPIDLVVLDPPRAGLNPKARQALIELAPQQIIYISCDPSTLARDLKHLAEAGYSLQNLQAFDMFPQTAHVETMTVLRRTQRVTS